MNDKDIIGKDKAFHFIACFILTIINPFLAIGAGIGKEYGDYKALGNHWCWWDILADTIGLLSGLPIWWLIWIYMF